MLLSRVLEHIVAVVREVHPGALDQGTGDPRHRLADDLLGAVCRAGVGDDPAINPPSHRVDAATNDVRLVLDDHVQADRLAMGIHRCAPPMRVIPLEASGRDPGRAIPHGPYDVAPPGATTALDPRG